MDAEHATRHPTVLVVFGDGDGGSPVLQAEARNLNGVKPSFSHGPKGFGLVALEREISA